MQPIDLAERLQNAEFAQGHYSADCPISGHGRLRFDVGDSLLALDCDQADCSPQGVAQALGVSLETLLSIPLMSGSDDRARRLAEGSRVNADHYDDANGLTVAEYAHAKRLPEAFLRELGLRDARKFGRSVVVIPYLDDHGTEFALRFRIALDGPRRFSWQRGTQLRPYGLWRLHEARDARYVLLVEGESDTHTLWRHHIPAVGIPGAGAWREPWAQYLEGIQSIAVLIEPGGSGESMLSWISKSTIRDRVRLVRLQGFKDPSALHFADPERFRERFNAALEAAIPWTEHVRHESEAKVTALRAQCAMLAREPRILDRLVAALHQRGVVGEDRAVKLLYLVKLDATFHTKPVSAIVKGQSSSGKNFIIQSVLMLFPPTTFSAISSMSERALIYDDEPLAHRTLVVYEQAGIDGDFLTYLIRSLLSEQRMLYKTVMKTAEGMRTITIEREGPTNLITTTTKIHIDPETETRLISIPTNDTPEQTAQILAAQAAAAQGATGDADDPTPWHALHEWLSHAEHRVVIPFARQLARRIPPAAVRLRRDFPTLLGLIGTHALLHQMTRQRDASGRIVATLGDYGEIRTLVADLFAEGVEMTVRTTVRASVQAVRDLLDEAVRGDVFGIKTTTVAAVARRLHLEKSTALRRVEQATIAGYLKNLEARPGRPAKLILGDPLPEEQVLLPAPDDPGLQGCGPDEGDAPSLGAPLPEVGTGRSNCGSARFLRPKRTQVPEGHDGPLDGDQADGLDVRSRPAGDGDQPVIHPSAGTPTGTLATLQPSGTVPRPESEPLGSGMGGAPRPVRQAVPVREAIPLREAVSEDPLPPVHTDRPSPRDDGAAVHGSARGTTPAEDLPKLVREALPPGPDDEMARCSREI